MTEQNETHGAPTGLASNRASLVALLIILVVVFITTLVGALGILFIGRILTLIFGLALFEASLIALGTALGIVYVLVQVLRPQPALPPFLSDLNDEDYEDEEDWEDDEEDVIIPPPSRNDPCPCGSGKKYKYCHGREA